MSVRGIPATISDSIPQWSFPLRILKRPGGKKKIRHFQSMLGVWSDPCFQMMPHSTPDWPRAPSVASSSQVPGLQAVQGQQPPYPATLVYSDSSRPRGELPGLQQHPRHIPQPPSCAACANRNCTQQPYGAPGLRRF